MIEIRNVPTLEAHVWNEFVLQHPKATYAHLYEWTSAIEKVYQLHSFHLAATHGSGIIAVMPVVIIRYPLRGSLAFCLPYSGYAGDLIAAGYDRFVVLDAFQQFLREHQIYNLELWQVSESPGTASQEVTLRLAISGSAEDLWGRLDSKVRNLVRKAERSGLIARWGIDQLPDFYRIYSRNMAQLGTPVHPGSLFEELSHQLGLGMDVLTVRKDGLAIAAMVVVRFRQRLADPWASSLREYSSCAPNMLLYWEALKYGCNHGFGEFDFGRSEVGSGTFNFKQQWGALPVALERLKWVEGSMKQLSVAKIYRGGVAGVFRWLWGIIPYPVTLWIGPKLRKYLP